MYHDILIAKNALEKHEIITPRIVTIEIDCLKLQYNFKYNIFTFDKL